MCLAFNFFATPFFLLSISQKVDFLLKQDNYVRKKIKIDSLVYKNSAGSKSLYHYENLYYDGGRLIVLQNTSEAIFHSKIKLKKRNYGLAYLNQHNDSIYLWYHPSAKGQIALPDEMEVNTDGYRTHVLLKIILVLIALYTLIFLVRRIKKKKNEKK